MYSSNSGVWGVVFDADVRTFGTPFSLYAPVIVKYRDAKTDASTALEDALR